jgi:hypothetical protein
MSEIIRGGNGNGGELAIVKSKTPILPVVS